MDKNTEIALSETRKAILELIAKGEAKNVKDIEEKLSLNRSGILRHLDDSIEAGYMESFREGKERHFKMTLKGLTILGHYDFDGLIDKSGILQDYECTKFLKRAIENQFIEIQDKTAPCIQSLLKYRLIKFDADKCLLSSLAIAVLINNPSFKNDFAAGLPKLAKALLPLVKAKIRGRLSSKKLDNAINSFSGKMLESVSEEMKIAKEELKDQLYYHNKTLQSVLDDDTTFYTVERIIQEHINYATYETLFRMLGRMIFQ